MDSPDSEMVFYLMLRAVDRFYQQHSRYPGTTHFNLTSTGEVVQIKVFICKRMLMCPLKMTKITATLRCSTSQHTVSITVGCFYHLFARFFFWLVVFGWWDYVGKKNTTDCSGETAAMARKRLAGCINNMFLHLQKRCPLLQ